jgi:predicted acetyltransferase
VSDNLASRRVIEANGGEVVERFRQPTAHEDAELLRYRIVFAK